MQKLQTIKHQISCINAQAIQMRNNNKSPSAIYATPPMPPHLLPCLLAQPSMESAPPPQHTPAGTGTVMLNTTNQWIPLPPGFYGYNNNLGKLAARGQGHGCGCSKRSFNNNYEWYSRIPSFGMPHSNAPNPFKQKIPCITVSAVDMIQITKAVSVHGIWVNQIIIHQLPETMLIYSPVLVCVKQVKKCCFANLGIQSAHLTNLNYSTCSNSCTNIVTVPISTNLLQLMM